MLLSKRIFLFFLLLAACPLFGSLNNSTIVKKSAAKNGVVTVDAEIKGESVQLICFLTMKDCKQIPSGKYLLIRLNGNEGTYNDCPNVDIYGTDDVKYRKPIGEYCLLEKGH